MASAVAKRKAKSTATSSRKKAKTSHLTANDLAWKSISTTKEAGITSGFDGILELEEVENVEVVYEETEGGRIARFNVIDNSSSSENESSADESESSVVDNVASSSSLKAKETTTLKMDKLTFDSKTFLPEWHPYHLHPRLLRTLYSQKFARPTPIQAESLPTALKGKDVVGVAETGSGKTLAYGLPILHSLLDTPSSHSKKKRPTRALILTPTRELAFQVSSHLNACLQDVEIVDPAVKAEEVDSVAPVSEDRGKGSKKGKDKGKGKGKEVQELPPTHKGPPPVSVAAIVGGMSAQKQRRILDRGVDVLVATPGRLWDILQEDDDLASQIKNLRFLVLDEADRMIETGHFAELDNILRLTMRTAKDEAIEPEDSEDEQEPSEKEVPSSSEPDLQTFVFSATLSKDLQKNLKKRQRWKGGKKNQKVSSTLDDLVMKLDFRDPDPTVINLAPEGGVVSTLKESKIDCLANDKDAYLYYFLLRYPGRSLVFLSSIDGIRRLLPLLTLLEVNAFPLHSQLEQRQRLKNLDRFKNTPNSVLLATDIAARGLDIPSVDHVVHYQVPRSADVYVHRNGRTARAMRDGFSMLMCAPDERRLVKALMSSLGRNEEEIPETSVELYLLDKLKARIQLAREIDSAQHKVKKENHEKNWLREAAEAMELEIDSDMGLSDDDDDSKAVPSKHKKKTANAKTSALKAELKELLAQPLVARGVSTRYITSGSRSIVDDVMAGQYHEGMLGLKKSQAGTDLVAPKKKSKPKKVKEEFEEWHGIETES